MHPSFNDRLRQILLLIIILIMIIVIGKEMAVFFPGIMGAITLYILTSSLYNQLTLEKKWRKGWTAMLFIISSLLLISIPVFLTVRMISPVINRIMQSPNDILSGLKNLIEGLEATTGIRILSEENITSISRNISAFIPKLLNSTFNLIANTLMLFFLYYYLLVNGKESEQHIGKIIPLKPANVKRLATETKSMVKANAIGIPAISFVQGVFGALGYWIFGVQDWAMWGILTGIFAFFPLIGTMAIWVPIVVSMYIAGNNVMATGLGLYSLIITGNVDYIARLMLMKKLVNVHPLITIFGVIAGLSLFGFMGLIFGPLLVSYLIILVRIYMNEFTEIRETV